MHPSKPLGSSLFGPLFVRVPLGLYLILAGLVKLNAPLAFVEEVHKFGVLPKQLGDLYGILLPYLEILSGGFIVLGLWTTVAALISSLLLLSFVIALGLHPTAGPFNKDLILLGASLSLLYTGAGAVSVDSFKGAG